jgi:hypothetical protein
MQTNQTFQFKLLTPEILEHAADLIASEKAEFMCIAVQLVVRDAIGRVTSLEYDVRKEFEEFLKSEGVSTLGWLEQGLEFNYEQRQNLRVLFLLSAAEIARQQQEENKPVLIDGDGNQISEKSIRAYISALRLYAYKPKEFFSRISDPSERSNKHTAGTCFMIKHFSYGEIPSYDIWPALCNYAEDCKVPTEVQQICVSFDNTHTPSGRHPDRIKMTKSLYQALRKYYPV